MRSSIATGLIAAVLALIPAAGAQEAGDPPAQGGAPDVGSAAAILVNISDDSKILFTRNAKTPRAPASLTKVVTALVVRDVYDLDEEVVTDGHVLLSHGSDLGLEPGMRISVRDLLYALLLKSANDSGMALAAHHPAGYEFFIALMNEKARSLGAYNSQFRNPHGLDQVGHYSSAHDMAVFARELLRDPVLAAMVDEPEHTMRWKGRDRTFGTHNKLIRSHDNVIGIKTGFTNQAGHSLISGATTPAGTLVTVVMGSPDHYGETLSLFEFGKSSASRTAAGGGPADSAGFGFLAEPPLSPDLDETPALAIDDGDPRDDLRWPLAMTTLAALAAATLLATARRDNIAPTPGQVWLAKIAAEERARR